MRPELVEAVPLVMAVVLVVGAWLVERDEVRADFREWADAWVGKLVAWALAIERGRRGPR